MSETCDSRTQICADPSMALDKKPDGFTTAYFPRASTQNDMVCRKPSVTLDEFITSM